MGEAMAKETAEGSANGSVNGSANEADGRVGVRLPSRFCLLLALCAGLFVAWWESFHEIACGGISIRAEVPLLYTYASCYAHAIGCLAGACAALWVLHRRGLGRCLALVGRLVLAMAGLTLVFFVCLGYGGYLPATAVQVIFNVCAMAVIVLCVGLLGGLALSDATFVIFACLILFAVADNVVLPLIIYLFGSLVSVLPALALLAATLFLLARELTRMPEWKALMSKAAPAAADGAPSAPRVRLPWQPLFHVAAYGLVFGVMHVEASSLISAFLDRDLPYAAGAVLAAVIFYACFARVDSGSFVWPKIRTVVFPLAAASFLLLPLLGSLESFAPVALVNAANLFYDAVLVLGVLYVGRESEVATPVAFVAAVAVKMTFFFVGCAVCHAQLAFAGADALRTPLAALAAFVLLVAATLWVGDDYRARRLWGMRIDRGPRHTRDVELQAKCNYLAKRYHLTPKEREVAFLLVSGKRVNQIADAMFVSVSTTRTHVRNLYAALDVHSFDELFALVGSVDPVEAFSTGA